MTKIENESIRNTKESPTLSFLQREMSNALGLISSIHYNLGAVSKLLRGTLVLTQELDAIVQSLLRGETPAAWHEKWSTGPEDYSSFCSSLITKAQALVVRFVSEIDVDVLKHISAVYVWHKRN